MNSTLIICLLASHLTVMASAAFEVKIQNQRIEIIDGGKTVCGWQHQPLAQPKGGDAFDASAFIHPLCTPSGFELTRIQPDDHLHHFGVWWPWKMLTVDGKKYVTWEMQEHQGRHRAESGNVLKSTADEVSLELDNLSEISDDGSHYREVLRERAIMRLSRMGKDAYVLDIHISQHPAKGVDVAITNYRYSGFSWRGTSAWNKDNSVMRTSGGHHRDNANHQAAKWVSVDGASPAGRATMLLMCAAEKDDGPAELLRVWGAGQENGAPFVNFNPVVKQAIPLMAENKPVSDRHYRLVMADRVITPAEADKLWRDWQPK